MPVIFGIGDIIHVHIKTFPLTDGDDGDYHAGSAGRLDSIGRSAFKLSLTGLSTVDWLNYALDKQPSDAVASSPS